MAEFKHLVLVKFKEEFVVENVVKQMEKLVSEMDIVKSFAWGQDIESLEMLRQGFTHAFWMTVEKKFSTVIDKAVLLDFPVITVKSAA